MVKCVKPECMYSDKLLKCVKPNKYIEYISFCSRNNINRKDCEIKYKNIKNNNKINSCKLLNQRIKYNIEKYNQKVKKNKSNNINKHIKSVNKIGSPILSDSLKRKLDSFIRRRAAKKIQKLTLPFINRVSSDVKDRIRFYNLFNNYLKGIKNTYCLNVIGENKYSIANDKLLLMKRIGSDSVFGSIYMTKGKDKGELFRVASKIMARNKSNRKEIKILEFLTDIVLNNKNPHFPIMYKNLTCYSGLYNNNLPKVIKDSKSYYINFNEIASGDLNMFMNSVNASNYKLTNNALAQIYLSIFSFHVLGYNHYDAHYGNFLYHRIKPGGYIKYNINGITYYLENLGYLWVIWDFGFVKKTETINIYKKTFKKDYDRIINAFINKTDFVKGWIDDKYRISDNTRKIVKNIDYNLLNTFYYNNSNDKYRYDYLFFETCYKNLFLRTKDLPKGAKIINSEEYKIY